MAKEIVAQGTEHNTLAFGTKVTGEIQAENDFRLDGNVEGKISCKGKVVIGAKGFVEGSLTCTNAEISGTLKGKIYVSDKLTLRSTAKIEGEIYTKILSVEEGAKITGTCDMNSNAPTSKAQEEKK
ncbi:MAG: polymer-forming cytoskeletal protein [Paludibacteraceae bacterium]|nr:polymer-forming cytoskeletal protein [Paludibacteraceae bacterium]